MGDAAVATIRRIMDGWPTRIEDADIAALAGLSTAEAIDLSNQMMAALPAGPLGASEATRLGQLATVLDRLHIAPDPASVAAMRMRYERKADPLPASVAHQLQALARGTPTRPPGVLGGDPEPPIPRNPVLIDDDDNDDGPVARRRPDSMPTIAPFPPPGPVPRGVPEPPPNPLPTVAPEPSAEAERFFNADIEDHDMAQPLDVGEQYSVAFDIAMTQRALSGGALNVPGAAFDAADDGILGLAVQLASIDFEILGDAQRPLRLPRTGPSKGKARFDIVAKRAGQCQLTATLHNQGNFVNQLQLSIPVGQAGTFEAKSIGRPVNSTAVLEPRDLSLVIQPGVGGFTCTALGSRSGFTTTLPLSAEQLAAAAKQARDELTSVVTGVYDGKQVFLESIDIPADVEKQALKRLAEAGKRLFQRLFDTADEGRDARSVGDWLVTFGTDPALQLTLQVFAHRVPIPWSMLYLGDVTDDATLDWTNFVGMRHIVEQLPFGQLPETTTNHIDSEPDLSVSLNINPTIDAAMHIDLVAAHQRHWTEIAATRRNLTIVPRSTRAALLAALADPGNSDKVLYFYCHATSSSDDPDDSAIIMGDPQIKSEFATLRDLNLKAPTKIQLAGGPLVFLNACESADLSPEFYDGFVPFFLAKGARGVIGTECKTPVLFAIHWGEAFVDRLLDGAQVGQTTLDLRQQFLRDHRNPLGLLYTVYCDADTRIAPPLPVGASPI